jgi:hypothetical protein
MFNRELTEIRNLREIRGQLQTENNQHVAYLGLYNPSPYISRIGDWIKSLSTPFEKSRSILIVDNASIDGSEEEVCNLTVTLEDLGWRVLFVRNPINLGGWGSLQLNLDLISDFKWVTTFHQDDFYSPDHLAINERLSFEVAENVALISREAVSVDSKNQKLGYPRAAWLVSESQEPEEVFIGLIRNHFLPFSGAAFRMEFLNEYQVPWTSTSFPDTEILLSGIPKWSYVYNSDSEVTYFENPESESHSLGQTSRDYGAALALLRVFERDGFSALTSDLGPEKFSCFMDDLWLSIQSRIKDQVLANLVFGHGLQVGMKSRSKAGLDTNYVALENLYLAVEDCFAANLAKRFEGLRVGSEVSEVRNFNIATTRERSRRTPKTFILHILGRLPQKALRKFWLIIFKSRIFRKNFPNWDI